jgi:hypothetical protein
MVLRCERAFAVALTDGAGEESPSIDSPGVYHSDIVSYNPAEALGALWLWSSTKSSCDCSTFGPSRSPGWSG